jgi:hypothetical protein
MKEAGGGAAVVCSDLMVDDSSWDMAELAEAWYARVEDGWNK